MLRKTTLTFISLILLSGGQGFEADPNYVGHFTSEQNLHQLIHRVRQQETDREDSGDENDQLENWESVFFHVYTPENGLENPQVIKKGICLFAQNIHHIIIVLGKRTPLDHLKILLHQMHTNSILVDFTSSFQESK